MYSEEQRVKALRMYHRIGSVTDTVRRLGYPSREQLHNWIRNEGKPRGKRKKHSSKNTIEHPRNPPAEFKLEVLRRCFEKGDSVKLVSEEIGYSRASIYVAKAISSSRCSFSDEHEKHQAGKITGHG